MIFDFLDQGNQNIVNDFYMVEHACPPNDVEYKKWKLEKFDKSLYSSMEL